MSVTPTYTNNLTVLESAQGNTADAVRHAYWNALNSRIVGREMAAEIGTAHEMTTGNYAADEAMDLWNNQVGRAIAAENPGASRGELLQLVTEAVENGRMVVVTSKDTLAWSNEAPGIFLPHGPTPPVEGIHDDYPTQDRVSYGA
jgi:hypothetical protein